jgi:hypothetical protein
MKAVYPPAQVAPYDFSFFGASPPAIRWTKPTTRAVAGPAVTVLPRCHSCRNSLLYKGSKDDDELELEVTGWAWNKRTKTKTMMTVTRMRVKGSMVAMRLRLVG